VLQAFEFEIHEDRKPLNTLVDNFFPMIESILGNTMLSQSENYISIMILIGKIFFMSNQIEVNPYFMNNPNRIGPWVDLFTQNLESQLPVELITPTEDMHQISMLNKSPEWKLKGILA